MNRPHDAREGRGGSRTSAPTTSAARALSRARVTELRQELAARRNGFDDLVAITHDELEALVECYRALVAIGNCDGSWDPTRYAEDVLDGIYEGDSERYMLNPTLVAQTLTQLAQQLEEAS